MNVGVDQVPDRFRLSGLNSEKTEEIREDYRQRILHEETTIDSWRVVSRRLSGAAPLNKNIVYCILNKIEAC